MQQTLQNAKIDNCIDGFARSNELLVDNSVHRSDTDAVTTTEAPPVREKRVGKGGGARCLSVFLVALARENDSSHFSL